MGGHQTKNNIMLIFLCSSPLYVVYNSLLSEMEVMMATEDMKMRSFPNLSTPVVLMNVFPMFRSFCLCLSKADIDSTLNSTLFQW